MPELKQLLISGRPLFISKEGFREAIYRAFHFPVYEDAKMTISQTLSSEQLEKYLENHTFYQTMTHASLFELLSTLKMDDTISVTDEYSDETLPCKSIAYHRIWGEVVSDSYWSFSSKQMEKDLIAAENNPQISCHFLHVNSPGGEAWYLDRLSETLRNCDKPIITLYEGMCCSAAYYIGCHGEKLYATTSNDYVGCIGTMCSFYDFEGYFEKMGIKKIEVKATNSDLKNKTFDDLLDGKNEKFIKEILNPLNDQFLAEVRQQRTNLAKLDNDSPALRGETYYTQPAIEIGLADGIRTFSEAMEEASSMAAEYDKTKQLQAAIYNT